MNVEGAANERQLGRTVMPLFHAMFSGGTILGAALGAAGRAGRDRDRRPSRHHRPADDRHGAGRGPLPAARSRCGRGRRCACRATGRGRRRTTGWRSRIGIWRDRRTLLIGLIVLGMAFAEGSRQRLARARHGRRSRGRQRHRCTGFRHLRDRHDGRPGVRRLPPRPVRPGAGAAGVRGASPASAWSW